jgi:hypothetical protein
VDPLQPIEKQGNFDLFLHKVTDEMVAAPSNPEMTIVENIEQYLARNPQIINIDPVDNQVQTLNVLMLI